jgi:hypothetical protein
MQKITDTFLKLENSKLMKKTVKIKIRINKKLKLKIYFEIIPTEKPIKAICM